MRRQIRQERRFAAKIGAVERYGMRHEWQRADYCFKLLVNWLIQHNVYLYALANIIARLFKNSTGTTVDGGNCGAVCAFSPMGEMLRSVPLVKVGTLLDRPVHALGVIRVTALNAYAFCQKPPAAAQCNRLRFAGADIRRDLAAAIALET